MKQGPTRRWLGGCDVVEKDVRCGHNVLATDGKWNFCVSHAQEFGRLRQLGEGS